MPKYEKTETIFLPDYSAASKERFFALLRQNYRVLTAEEMVEIYNEQRELTIAWFDYGLEEYRHGDRLHGLQVNINEGAFLLNSRDDRDLIPITVEHEIVEGWIDLKFHERDRNRRATKTIVDRNGQGLGHHVALRAEFRLAHQLGLADRYLKLTQIWAKFMEPVAGAHFLTENHEAYWHTKNSQMYLR